ncbi:PorP/SprF family type IX secretion system membrane protein [Solitalea canadensis]|uniref:Bacteroidetes-specific putative membrane protein n=1 Tax=Solitalea canadensis (strain ATCC 29591 / DSM 3403 / JCM 21819 / LMG 8368 / NBRC 15130 / NCIMB 12057 / USAM 9D) TaxID=929556 RepID=H8KPJ4_SOLCM|nr:type IX secretion system membrane protein PorP/SprF [Solitalea canadensis]AFD05892.1 Bacteroidetes-specific putative membrane protein [Solitalea canadensis DSM 3403]
MKNFLLTIALSLLMACAYAQQRPQYTLYMQNNYILNPAIGGIEDYYDLKLSYRSQWVGLEGAPKTGYASFHAPIGDVDERHHGVGGYIVSDKTDATSRLSFDLSYAYHLPISGNMKVSFGVAGGFTQYSTDADKLNPANPGDMAVVSGTQYLPDVTAGIWLYSDKFYVGASGLQLIPATLSNSTSSEKALNKYRAHYFFTTGYRFPIGYDFMATPSIMVKWIDPAPASMDFNFKLMYQETVWAGVSYRKADSFSALIGLNISSLINVAYSYDYGVNELTNFNKGSHEIILGLQLNNSGKVKCPRNVW